MVVFVIESVGSTLYSTLLTIKYLQYFIPTNICWNGRRGLRNRETDGQEQGRRTEELISLEAERQKNWKIKMTDWGGKKKKSCFFGMFDPPLANQVLLPFSTLVIYFSWPEMFSSKLFGLMEY